MRANWARRAVRDFLVGDRGKFVFEPRHSVQLPDISGTDLYIHIPFCHSLCPYCPYNRILYDESLAGPYLESLHQEIALYRELLGDIEVGSIYIGGGTPTTLLEGLGPVLDHIRTCFTHTGPVAVETIPSDLDEGTLTTLRSMGVSLLSIGVQSFDDHFLKLIGRRYRADILPGAVSRALAAGFDSISLDLMFALPGQTTDQALADLEMALALGAEQATLYPLFTFPYSSVGALRQLKDVKYPKLRTRRVMYRKLHDYALSRGMDRISVWGFRKHGVARFSSVTRDNYIGIGAGAGSCQPGIFYFNTFSVPEYIRSCSAGKLPVALQMQLNDAIQRFYWLYWRLYETSVAKAAFTRLFADDRSTRWLMWVAGLLHLLTDDGNRYVLTERGSFWIHLLQNYYVLDYIDKVWTRSRHDAWPGSVRL
jgi:oxygen-independent coproporphyrinogen-3 oxidase